MVSGISDIDSHERNGITGTHRIKCRSRFDLTELSMRSSYIRLCFLRLNEYVICSQSLHRLGMKVTRVTTLSRGTVLNLSI